MKQNFFHIGSLPFNSIAQVRIHWLLDLIQIRIEPDSSVKYNFTLLDELIFQLWRNNLYPGFELMGNPSNYFNDFVSTTQVYTWRNLINALAVHYISLYGIDYVRRWNFETWNEPDHHDFDKLNFTIQGFLNYYDACSEGLKLADKRLKFGGPGGSCRIPSVGHSPICWALLEHCMKGKNFFTGEIGSRLDFISFHKKGNATSRQILDEEMETINYMRNFMKIPSKIPFYNDEADPMKNWALPQLWRADVTYAAMVVKIILYHIEAFYLKNETRDIHFDLLSNDNAFLSYFPHQFTQRTLLARFQVNNTSPRYVEFIRKPVYTTLGLLSQLCHNVLHTEIYKEGKPLKNLKDDFGIIATHCAPHRDQIIIIMYNSADSILSGVNFDIDLILNTSSSINKFSDAKWVTLELNNAETNPYLMWIKLGKPTYPTRKQFSIIKDNEGPRIKGPWSIDYQPPWKFHFQLLNPGVTMINICKTRKSLRKVVDVRFLQIRNNTLQISWTDKHNKCVFTYNIEYSNSAHGPYIQLNRKNVVFPSFWHSCSENDVRCCVQGFYRVYAVDYWHIHGPFSKPVKFRGYN